MTCVGVHGHDRGTDARVVARAGVGAGRHARRRARTDVREHQLAFGTCRWAGRACMQDERPAQASRVLTGARVDERKRARGRERRQTRAGVTEHLDAEQRQTSLFTREHGLNLKR
ncbi:hypothetical protein CDL15_Pgr008318 [Punica granatum]|nr:hypothetical protein CDL15_Pgr008318 [Punica granatum]